MMLKYLHENQCPWDERLFRDVDANNADKADRHRCVLYVTERRSDAGFGITLLGLVPEARDHIGILPMRGESLNIIQK